MICTTENINLKDTIWYYMPGKEVIAGKVVSIDYLSPEVTFVSILTLNNTKINMNIENTFTTYKEARAYQIAWEVSKVGTISKHYDEEELEIAINEYGYMFL